jgi:hypothetical protein
VVRSGSRGIELGSSGVVANGGNRTLARSQAVNALFADLGAPQPPRPPLDHRGMVLIWIIGEGDDLGEEVMVVLIGCGVLMSRGAGSPWFSCCCNLASLAHSLFAGLREVDILQIVSSHFSCEFK